jgi:hypothetical protein
MKIIPRIFVECNSKETHTHEQNLMIGILDADIRGDEISLVDG